jgi:hypothetical protein
VSQRFVVEYFVHSVLSQLSDPSEKCRTEAVRTMLSCDSNTRLAFARMSASQNSASASVPPAVAYIFLDMARPMLTERFTSSLVKHSPEPNHSSRFRRVRAGPSPPCSCSCPCPCSGSGSGSLLSGLPAAAVPHFVPASDFISDTRTVLVVVSVAMMI